MAEAPYDHVDATDDGQKLVDRLDSVSDDLDIAVRNGHLHENVRHVVDARTAITDRIYELCEALLQTRNDLADAKAKIEDLEAEKADA